jgi:hypothetical protein
MALEPIEESDLNLENKFIERKAANIFSAKDGSANESILENVAERREGVVEKDDAYAKIVSKIQAPAPQTTVAEVTQDADQAGKLIDAQSRINNLVDVAMQKGVLHAVRVAKHLDDNYILDEFHDKLVMDEFHDALVEKGLIKDM